MKLLSYALFLLSVIPPISAASWSTGDSETLQKATLELTPKIRSHTAIIGRTGLADTRVAVAISDEGHLLAPFIPSIDGEDAPYLLYLPDGSRISLETLIEKKRRGIALLKLETPIETLLPAPVAKLRSHSFVLPICAPIAAIGEPVSLIVDHLIVEPKEDDKSFRLDQSIYPGGSPVFELSGALVGFTLSSTDSATPAIPLTKLLSEMPELDNFLEEFSNPALPRLPQLPEMPSITPEELKELTESELTEARAINDGRIHQRPLPCVQIFNQNQQSTNSVIGTIVRQDGLILTKASELGPDLRVKYDGENYPAVLLATDEKTDLALVGISARNLPVVRWSDRIPAAGSSVSSPVLLSESSGEMTEESTTSLGILSHSLQGNSPTLQATSMVTSLGLITEQLESGLVVAAITPETPAVESGAIAGDKLLTIDGKEISRRTELTAILNSRRVGEKVTLKIMRGETEKEIPLKLTAPNLMPPATGISATSQNIAMIPSVRRSPFPEVLVHSTTLMAWDCGSPLFDLEGRAIGINIAACAPGRSLTLPTSIIRRAMKRLLASSKPL